MQDNDLAEAKRLNDRIYPLAQVFYADPWADMHNRMKEALVLLGRLPRAVVRPPLVKLGARRDRPHPRGAGRRGPAGVEGQPRRGVGLPSTRGHGAAPLVRRRLLLLPRLCPPYELAQGNAPIVRRRCTT